MFSFNLQQALLALCFDRGAKFSFTYPIQTQTRSFHPRVALDEDQLFGTSAGNFQQLPTKNKNMVYCIYIFPRYLA
jgi:hypothetical protein